MLACDEGGCVSSSMRRRRGEGERKKRSRRTLETATGGADFRPSLSEPRCPFYPVNIIPRRTRMIAWIRWQTFVPVDKRSEPRRQRHQAAVLLPS